MHELNASENSSTLSDGALSSDHHTADAINTFFKNGVDSVVHTSHQLRDGAKSASEKTVHFIQEEPIKSVLIAAATGAALIALVGMVRRPSMRG